MSRRVIHFVPWYQRPLRCFLGMHQWIQCPGHSGWVYCADCDAEKEEQC